MTLQVIYKIYIEPKMSLTSSNLDAAIELIHNYEESMAEQNTVIKEYESIFDSQVSKIPCICGENVFEGIFSPTAENIVECEACDGNFKITLNYESTLIAKPLNLTGSDLFDQLKTESESH